MILLKFNDSDVKNAFESVVNGLPESKYDATFKENTIALIENQYQSYYTPFMYVQGESDSKQSAITAFKLTLTPFFMRYINIGIQETYFNGLTYGNEAKETQEQIINEGTKTSDNPVNSIYQNLTNRVDRNGNNKNTLTRPDGRTPFGALEEDRGVLSPLFEMVNAFSMLLVSPDDECYCDELCDTFGFEIEKLYAQMNNLQTEVSAISDDVNKNTGAITELSEKVTQNTGDISTLKNDVSTNTSDISALNDRVTQNRSDITQLESDMAEAKTDISENTTNISNLSTRVTSAEDNITAHTSQINQIDETLKNDVSTNTSDISALNDRVTQNRSDITQLESDMAEAKTDISENTTNISNLSTRVTSAEDNITAHTSQINQIDETLKNDVSTNTSDISALNDRVTQNRSDITQLESDMAEAKTDISENTTNISNLSTRVTSAEDNITAHTSQINQIDETLKNKVDIIKNPVSNFVAYVHINQKDENVSFTESAIGNTIVYRRASDGGFNVSKGTSGQNVANMENIADVEAKIPDVSNFATKSELSNKLDISGGTINGNLKVIGNINTDMYLSDGIKVIDVDFSNIRVNVGHASYNINMFSSNRPTVTIGENTYNIALKNDIPKYTSVDSVIYDTTNGAIIAYDGAHEIHIPLQAGENVTIDASEDNKKIVISAAGGGGTGDVTAAGNNTFTGVNTFNNSIYAKNGVVAENTTNYGANSVRKGPNTYSFPNKSGTFAMTNDVIKEPIYFISFYANAPADPYHLSGTLMSKNSYGTGQKTNEEFAIMLADNLYTNSNEGLAAYGKLAGKDISCIYSEDGLSIRCLDEENSDVELPTLSFFIMETEL